MQPQILAVIPARAESKGIPNKNIRFIEGHPLIYYAIHNAITSTSITDIVVTTDSPEVRIIAKQMGVRCHWRDKKLAGDEVTLDSVIYDAIPKETSWDYIVTMQPTSPTLTVETLENAIKYAMEQGIDTLISAVNDPHLSWGISEEKKVPNFTKRLNRQQLPPSYRETGAFMISRASIVTEGTRIGEKVALYEVPEEESQDIDTFSDIYSVMHTLTRERVAIYVNGNSSRGIGHIYRALELADEFYTKPDIYYDINQTDPKIFGRTTHRLIGVNGITELFEYCKIKQYTVFINDILTTSIDYMIGLRSVLPNARVINFEDDGEGIFKADLVINALYEEHELPKVFSGENYYISGKTFMFYSPILIQQKVQRVFISFGGSDPQNYTDRILNIVSKEELAQYQFVVVLGRMKNNVERLMQYNKYPNIEVLHDISNMPEIMTSCDIAITSRGRTGYELAMLGIPTIAMAQNAREEKHTFISNENGFTYLGLNPNDEIIEGTIRMYLTLSKKSREYLQELLLKHDLRNGRSHVMHLINRL